MTKLQDLTDLGQSIWFDYIRRSFINSGELRTLIDQGVRGVTSNPTIFEKAIAGSSDYDEDIQKLIAAGKSVAEIYTALTLDDIGQAADLLRPVYDATDGLDGYVSLEVDPTLAHDAERLRGFVPPDTPYVFFLPALDPFIMGYTDRRRFLAAEHRSKVFDRAGNAVPTVWADGRVAGVWGQRKDGSVTYGLFEPVRDEERAALEDRRQQLEGFLDGELLRPRLHTPFTRALT